MAQPQAVVKLSGFDKESPEEMRMQETIISCAQYSLEHFNGEKDMSSYIKQELDRRFMPTWHVAVGRSFGGCASHEARRFLYFYIGQMGFMVFKTG